MTTKTRNNGDSYPVPVEDKPLNQTQLKNLRELVSGDFADLREQIEIDINRRGDEKIAEIEKRYEDQSDLEGFQEKVRQMQRNFEDEMQSLISDAKKQGIVVGGYRHDRLYTLDTNPELLKQEGKEEEITKVNRARNQMIQTAMRVLSREERNIQRQCLLQGIGATGAHDLIRDLPGAEDIMPLVSAELAVHNRSEAQSLMTEEEAKALEKEAK